MLSKSFWEDHYKDGRTNWDAGKITTPIKSYLDQLSNRDLKILIPGAGFGHEAEYAFRSGFEKTHFLEWSEMAMKDFEDRIPEFPKSQLHNIDFFKMDGDFDLIIEQTFFCALEPVDRKKYANKVYSLLKPGGKLIGVFFNFPLTASGPPYGGSVEEYFSIFEPEFDKVSIETCYNSIPPRSGDELFIIAKRTN